MPRRRSRTERAALLVVAAAVCARGCDDAVAADCATAPVRPWSLDWWSRSRERSCCARRLAEALGWDAKMLRRRASPYEALLGARSLRPFCDGALSYEDGAFRVVDVAPLPGRSVLALYFRGIGPGAPAGAPRDAGAALRAAADAASARNRSSALLIVTGDATFPPPHHRPVAGVEVWAANPGVGARAIPLGVSAGPNPAYSKTFGDLLASRPSTRAHRRRLLFCRGYRRDADRAEALARVPKAFDCGSEKLKLEPYVHALQDSKFVLCPRGFGAATFRFYEALLAGAVPVVLASDVDADLAEDMPVAVVGDFGDATPAALDAKWAALDPAALDLKKAFLPYWLAELARATR